jgi:hypothetical protein
LAEAKREYQTIFTIGAKLLGSFRGAMTAAQSRLRGLAVSARRTFAGLFKGIATGFLGAFAGLAVGALFRKIFGEAVQQAEQAEQRTKKLFGALMANEKMRQLGVKVGQEQTKLLQDHNEALSHSGVMSADILDTMTAQMALYKLSPQRLKDANAIMADQLAFSKGARATEEDALGLATAHGKAIMKGQVKGLEAYGVYMSKNEAKEYASLAKAGKIEQIHAKLLKTYERLSKGRNAAERLTPTGRIVEFQKAVNNLSQDLGRQLLPIMADIADAWRTLLPSLKPLLLGTFDAIGKGIAYASKQLQEFVQILGQPPALEAWQELKEAFGELGGALTQIAEALGIAVPEGQSFAKILADWVVADIKKFAQDLKDFAQGIKDLTTGFRLFPLAIDTYIIDPLNKLSVSLNKFSAGWRKIPLIGMGAPKEIAMMEHLAPPGLKEQLALEAMPKPKPTVEDVMPDLVNTYRTAKQSYTEVATAATESQKEQVSAVQQVSLEISATLLPQITQITAEWGRAAAASREMLNVQGVSPAVPAPPPAATTTGAGILARQAGGIIKKPEIAALAEKGPEAVIPLTRHKSRAAQLLSWASSALKGNVYVPPALAGGAGGYLRFGGPRAEIPEEYDPYGVGRGGPAAWGALGLLRGAGKFIGERAGREISRTHLNFNPSVTINGNATDAEQRAMDSRLRELAKDFIKQFSDAQEQERRLSYESGYGA